MTIKLLSYIPLSVVSMGEGMILTGLNLSQPSCMCISIVVFISDWL